MCKLCDCTLQQASAQQAAFEEQEKRYLRKVLVEERTRYCLLASCFRPVVVSLIRMFYSLLSIQIIINVSTRSDTFQVKSTTNSYIELWLQVNNIRLYFSVSLKYMWDK